MSSLWSIYQSLFITWSEYSLLISRKGGKEIRQRLSLSLSRVPPAFGISAAVCCRPTHTPKNVAAFAGKALAMAGPNPLKSALTPSFATVLRAQSRKPE